MNPETEQSFSQLKSFISYFKLQKNSLIVFKAKSVITTANIVEQEEDVEILVTFDTYGKAGELSFTKYDLDPLYYPTIFSPTYDVFTFVDNKFLRIEGTHTRNPDIGKYVIEIYPFVK